MEQRLKPAAPTEMPAEAAPATAATPPDMHTAPARGRFTMSPINRRRWRNFRANKRGLWSLRIFLVLFVVTLVLNFIALRVVQRYREQYD